MTQYLGHAIDSGTLHFKYEVCPACSSSKDKGGRLDAIPFEWWKAKQWDLISVSYPVYDKKEKKIVWASVNDRFLKNGEIDPKDLDSLNYLRCSRYPDCKYWVYLANSVLLGNADDLLEAQLAYQSGITFRGSVT